MQQTMSLGISHDYLAEIRSRPEPVSAPALVLEYSTVFARNQLTWPSSLKLV